MSCLKWCVRYLILVPIAVTVDLLTVVLKGLYKYLNVIFDKTIAWCNDER